MGTTLSKRQAISLVTLFVVGSTIYTQTAHPAKQDTWITLLVGAAAALPFLLIYCRIMSLFPGMSLYDIFYRLFGRVGGFVLSLVYIVFFLNIEVLIVQMFIQFNRLNIFPFTPLFVLALPMCLLGSWLATIGHTRLGRAAAAMLFLLIFTLSFTFISSTAAFNIDGVMPLFESSSEVFANSSFSFFSVPMTQTAVFLCVLHNMEEPKARRSGMVWGVFIGTVFIAMSIVRSTLIMGGETLTRLNYTSYIATSVIRIDSFIQRVETVLSLAFLTTTLFKISVYCYAAKEGFKKLFPRIKIKWLIVPVSLAVAVTASLIFPDVERSFAFADTARRYSAIFQIVVPVVIWLCGEVVNLWARKKNTCPGD